MSSSGLKLEKFQIPQEEIKRATKNFSSETGIGDGGFGMVYRGELSERWQNRTAAIKRLGQKSYQEKDKFQHELKLVYRFHHQNIIPFLGYCDEGLRNTPNSQVYIKVVGTDFYLDPIYRESGILRKESDVYSFGVVLFEMLSGTLAYRERSFGDGEEQYLISRVRQLVHRYSVDRLNELIDPHIKDHIDTRSSDLFKEIAYQCISLDVQKRPTMDMIIKSIKDALNIQVVLLPCYISFRRQHTKLESSTAITTPMASGARVFNGCRSLFAAAKSATPKPTAPTTAAKKKSTVKKSTEKPAKKPKQPSTLKPVGILKPSPISPALGDFLGGVSESPRTEAVKKIWEYIKLHELQNPTNKKEIICDEKLKTIFDGRDRVGFLEIAKLLAPHFVKTS
ncbi:hypothetical protein L6452_30247 [Arctium lappa]|uniref:Uncharacterized protein n=1 Tax=Arctium lappa TaxID=4217 RepID=A0ACB8ZJ33_ARCLA|nr:hypothetical protein L6452_30247 [Arctium lappa]